VFSFHDPDFSRVPAFGNDQSEVGFFFFFGMLISLLCSESTKTEKQFVCRFWEQYYLTTRCSQRYHLGSARRFHNSFLFGFEFVSNILLFASAQHRHETWTYDSSLNTVLRGQHLPTLLLVSLVCEGMT
jgi:hypothetical protein